MKKSSKWKVRFNLGRGEHFNKWKVSRGDEIYYYDPDEGSLYLKGCKFVNNRAKANRIYKGANKFVVAWIECDSFKFVVEEKTMNLIEDTLISYNPKINPFWEIEDQDVDGIEHEFVYTVFNYVCLKNPEKEMPNIWQ